MASCFFVLPKFTSLPPPALMFSTATLGRSLLLLQLSSGLEPILHNPGGFLNWVHYCHNIRNSSLQIALCFPFAFNNFFCLGRLQFDYPLSGWHYRRLQWYVCGKDSILSEWSGSDYSIFLLRLNLRRFVCWSEILARTFTSWQGFLGDQTKCTCR